MKFFDEHLQSLVDRTEYETWLLEAAYALAEQKIKNDYLDTVFYSSWDLSYRKSCQVVVSEGSIGSWQSGFLNAGAPLIFVSVFKLLDMLMEWIIDCNGLRVDFRFAYKQKQLNGNLSFPELIEQRQWLKERLIGLYNFLEKFRSAIIHHSQFSSLNGQLEITSTKSKNTLCISREQLRALAEVVVSTVRYVSKVWSLGHYQEKLLRFQLDQIKDLHDNQLLDQKRPFHVTVRYYQCKNENLLDLQRVKQDLEQRFFGYDLSFDLTLIIVSDKTPVQAFCVPWPFTSDSTALWENGNGWEQFQIKVPHDIEFEHLVGSSK